MNKFDHRKIAGRSTNALVCDNCELLVVGETRTGVEWFLRRHRLSEHGESLDKPVTQHND